MNITEWTARPALIEQAAQLQRLTTYQQMMGVMREEMPLSKIPIPLGSNSNDYAYAYGMQAGYEYALKMLKSLGETTPELPQEPESTFSINNL